MLSSERIALLVIGCLNVACGAVLAADGSLPTEAKVGVVVAQAVATYALAQIKSWGEAAPTAPPAP